MKHASAKHTSNSPTFLGARRSHGGKSAFFLKHTTINSAEAFGAIVVWHGKEGNITEVTTVYRSVGRKPVSGLALTNFKSLRLTR